MVGRVDKSNLLEKGLIQKHFAMVGRVDKGGLAPYLITTRDYLYKPLLRRIRNLYDPEFGRFLLIAHL